MFYKRPVVSFLAAFIIGIIVANTKISFEFKLLIALIAIFLHFRLFIQNKLTIRLLLFLILFFIFGFVRFKYLEHTLDNYEVNVTSLGKGSKILSGKVATIGKSTNSNYLIIENTISGDKTLGKSKCYFSDDIDVPDLKIGNGIKIKGSVIIIDDPSNEGEFNQKNYYRSDNITFLIFAKEIEVVNSSYDKLLQGIYDIKILVKKQINNIFNDKDAGLFTAMLTGDKSSIDKIQKKNFSDNGIAHILAISGLHLSILGIFLFELLRHKFSIGISASIVSIFILFYGIFIDAGPSSLRAIIMLYIRFLSLSIGRTYDSKNSLFIIALIFLIINPYLLYNAGFQFSYLAIYALNTDVVITRKKVTYNDKIVKVPSVIVLTIFLFPVTIYHYFTYPLYSILINLIVIPLMSFVLGFGISGLLISFLFLPLGKILAEVVHYIFIIYDFLCNFSAKLPYHILWVGRPTLYEVLFYYIALFLIIYSVNESTNKNRVINKVSTNDNIKNKVISFFDLRLRVILSLSLLIISIVIIGVRKRSNFRMTFLDVGQGDGAIVESKNLFLTIDGGSSSNSSMGEYLFVPHLKSRAIKEIEYSFISHSDSDHVNGVLYLLENEDEVSIKNLILPINAKNDDTFSNLINAASDRGTNVLYVEEGDTLNIKTFNGNNMLVDVLSPNNTIINEKKADVNEKSLMFRLDYGSNSALFTGDIGKKGINNIINNDKVKNKLKSTVLKVPHHGSKNSNVKEFFECASPMYSVISYKKDNSYGHPHKVTLDTLEGVGTKILKTAEKGQIDIYFDNLVYDKSYK